jgi:hypothetical protein
MGAYEGLSRYFPEGIVNKAHKLGYGEVFISILKGDEDILEQKYNSVWNNLKECKYSMEGRTPIEYGRDIISAWIFEDCVVGTLKSHGINVSYGKDYLTRKRFTIRPDKFDTTVTITSGNNKYSLELRCDYVGAWEETNTVYFPISKYRKMKKANSILLGFSTLDNKLILLGSKDIKNAKYIKSYAPFGGRPVYGIPIPESAVHTFSKTTMTKEIKNYCLYN